MRCPICRKQVEWEGNPFRPFCSERCKLIDLDNWLSERYRIPAPADSREGSAEAEKTAEEAGEKRD
jgi:endogenous inhibitor of DNA gyrase (YacG/DUF329 family)